jgi:hypothetical protein
MLFNNPQIYPPFFFNENMKRRYILLYIILKILYLSLCISINILSCVVLKFYKLEKYNIKKRMYNLIKKKNNYKKYI